MRSYNPATNQIVWEGKEASGSDVSQALEKAQKAFLSWKRLSFEERAGYCIRFAEQLGKNKELLASSISEEMGKPLWESLTEVQAMINKVDISIQAYQERCFVKVHDQAKVTVVTRYQPHGVGCVLGPFNFPGHLPNGHIVPALL